MKKPMVLGLVAAVLALSSLLWWRALPGDERPRQAATIGILNPNPAWEPAVAGLKTAMQRMGYAEGREVRYLYRGPLNRMEMLEPEARRLVGEGPNLLVALTTPATLSAKRSAAGAGIPVLFSPSNDPVGSGVVAGLRSPGANLTGVQTGGSAPKALEWLLAAVPRVSKLLVLHDPADKSSATALEDLRRGAAKLGVELRIFPYPLTEPTPAEWDAYFREAEGVFILPASRWVRRAAEVAARSVRLGLPTASVSPVADEGVLVVYGPDPYRVGLQAGRLAAQILRGIPARDLPVETSEFTLTLNLRTARASGLELSDALLRKADRVLR